MQVRVGNGQPPQGTNEPPRVNGDSAATNKDSAVVVRVLDNDRDTDGGTISLVSVTQPGNGTAVANPDGTVTYTPRAGFTGSAGGSGNGNYNLLSNSPAINFFPSGTNILPYDIAGQVRNNSGWGSAGAYEQAKILTTVFAW